MFRLLILLSIVLFNSTHANACSNNLACSECDRQSEFAWNPDSAYITNNLAYFYRLAELMKNSYQQGNYNTAAKHANEYLNLASAYRCNWNHGNAVHDANIYLGLISLKNNKVDKAVIYLNRASQTPGSMQLEAFGPELTLANMLLKEGEKDAVVKYLTRIDAIWDSNQQIYKWISKIEAGKRPYLQRPSEAQLQQRFAAQNIF